MYSPVLSTLAYHAQFSYPLTSEEVHKFLISDKPVSKAALKKEIEKLIRLKKIAKVGDFYTHLPESDLRYPISGIRLARQNISKKKLIIARRAARFIAKFPWVKLVAVTGALAMNNSEKDDDIDLMIVTAADRLWLTRPLVTALAAFFFRRRRANLPNSANLANSLCLNLWLDESALAIPKDQQSLYTAHELAQMKPIANKEKIYERLMWTNRWGRKFLANAWSGCDQIRQIRQISQIRLINLLNRFAFRLQLWYMHPKMTNERVSLHAAFFHPNRRADTMGATYDRLRHGCL